MQIVSTEFAEQGSRFAPDVFDSQVSKEVPFKINGEVHGTCTLLGVSVAEDGSFASMIFDVPDIFEAQPMSVALAEES